MMQAASFRKKLFYWFAQTSRPMPWHGQGAYAVWLSEIILQQTRFEQGLPYYLRFIENFPTVNDLANAPSEKVMQLWQGLGYYSRARNLHKSAQTIRDQFGGEFPNTYEDILSLTGIGPYSAAAISSFAFGLPHAVVDGNVYRVLSRIFGIETAIDSTQGKKEFQRLADELLDQKRPGDFNQAIMNFGATHCTPQQPKCADCPFQKECQAFLTNRIQDLPFKEKKIKLKNRYFHFFLMESKDSILIQQRTGKDIWEGLFTLPLWEGNADEGISKHEWSEFCAKQGWKDAKYSLELVAEEKQLLSHQKLKMRFYKVKVPALFVEEYGVAKERLEEYGYPKAIAAFLKIKKAQ
jgi:A/G-specific adenine glycosylase